MIRLLSTILFICLVINKPVLAQSACQNPVFGQSAIAIDKSAQTANEAQRLSMAEAHQEALGVVLERLIIGDVPESFVIAPESLVELVHIRSETSLPGRYIAEIDICFAPDQLRLLFSEANLDWAEVPSPLVLVLPVFVDGAGTRAWQEAHPWLSGWRDDALSANGLLRYTILQPTLVNERQIKAEKLLQADKATLQKAAERAQAEQILWVRASIMLSEGVPQLAMQALIFDKQGTVIATLADRRFNGQKSDYQAQITAFRKEVLTSLAEGWQKANLRRVGLSNQLVATITFDTHGDWIAKKTALTNLPVINEVQTLVIGANTSDDTSDDNLARAVVLLDMNGSVEALTYALAPVGLSLRFEDDEAVIE